MFGGYDPQAQEFSSESYILDEYRSNFQPLASMFYARADHAVHYFKDCIYVFGGMAFREEAEGGRPYIKSLNSCECFSIKTQKWTMLENFAKPRQAFSVCQFNDKFIFIIGGKRLKASARVPDASATAPGGQGPAFAATNCAFDFVQEVEAYDIEKGVWKTINYIADNLKLRTLHAGAIQVTGKKIMIFGGLVEHKAIEEGAGAGDSDEEQNEQGEKDLMVDGGQVVKLSAQSFYLDVTKGSIKRGPDL